METQTILTHQQIQHKIRRIAYQIYETNANESELIIAGIAPYGYVLAERLETVLKEISDIDVKLCKVSMDKENPLNSTETSLEPNEYENKSIVLVDDVLNTGSALTYGVHHFLNVPTKRFKTAVLVNRNHKKFPIKADFKGVSLSTSLLNHVEVKFGEQDSVCLK